MAKSDRSEKQRCVRILKRKILSGSKTCKNKSNVSTEISNDGLYEKSAIRLDRSGKV